MDSFSEAIESLAGKDIYLYQTPDVLDFTSNSPCKIKLFSKDVSVEIPLPNDLTKLKELLGILQFYIGKENTIIVSWNIKNFLSYVKAKTNLDFKLSANIYDLKILESYLSIEKEKPESYIGAFGRLKDILRNNSWKAVENIYFKVYEPLIKVLPKVEAIPWIKNGKKVYSHYELEGQVNGRLRCFNAYTNSFNPHSMGSDEKKVLNPNKTYIGECQFVYFDYKHMEVSVLQWLSKDDYLLDIIESGRDVYAALWEAFTSIPCDDKYRQKCKDFFLPVVYGLGANSMAKNLKIPIEHAALLIDRVSKTIPFSMAWIENQQNLAVNNVAQDYFGRIRLFDSPYKIRGFSVQSPAALICMHKLVKLSQALGDISSVGMSIHDGYILVSNSVNFKKAIDISKSVLESDDELYPGLKLRTSCKVGSNLDELKLYER